MKDTKKSAKGTTATNKKGFTAEERAAMKERARELKAEASESDVLATRRSAPTATNLVRAGVARIGIGPTREGLASPGG